jgi:large repetitive protein
MMKQGLLILLCATIAACDSGDATSEVAAELVGDLSPGGVVLGHIDVHEQDSYTFAATVGEGIVLRVTDVAGSTFTPWFTVYGPAGNAVTWAWGYDVAGRSFAAPSTGAYTVVLYDHSSGLAATGDYKLYYTKAPGANTGGALSPGAVALGHIDKGEIDSFTFTATVGEGIVLRVTDVAASTFTPWFTIYGPAGNAVTWAWGYDVAGRSFAAPSTGAYTVVLYDHSSGLAATGDYQLAYAKTL